MSEQAAPQPQARLRFRREQRVQSSSHFARAWREGGRARGATILVVAAANGLPHARLGLSVGKRIWKNAVPRNRLRRLLREAFRLEQAQLPAGFDLVLVPAQPKVHPPLALLRKELVALAHKASTRPPRSAGPKREARSKRPTPPAAERADTPGGPSA